MPLTAGLSTTVGERQLLWIDLLGREPSDIESVAAATGITEPMTDRLAHETGRADLTMYPDHIHLVLEALESVSVDGGVVSTDELKPGEIDLVAGQNWVVTVHNGPVGAIERIDALTDGETRLGDLTAAGFLASIVDEVLAGYLSLAEGIEREIDRLDERALRSKPGDEVLSRIVALRRRIGTIRRILTPHRLAFAALARPEMELHEELGQPWPALNDRLDRAIDAIENLRDLLLGTYDIHMGRAAQDANEIMKRLTLLSGVLLPSVILAGIMGMNFSMAFFDDTSNFWLVIAAMVAFAVTMLGAARWRNWL